MFNFIPYLLCVYEWATIGTAKTSLIIPRNGRGTVINNFVRPPVSSGNFSEFVIYSLSVRGNRAPLSTKWTWYTSGDYYSPTNSGSLANTAKAQFNYSASYQYFAIG